QPRSCLPPVLLKERAYHLFDGVRLPARQVVLDGSVYHRDEELRLDLRAREASPLAELPQARLDDLRPVVEVEPQPLGHARLGAQRVEQPPEGLVVAYQLEAAAEHPLEGGERLARLVFRQRADDVLEAL